MAAKRPSSSDGREGIHFVNSPAQSLVRAQELLEAGEPDLALSAVLEGALQAEPNSNAITQMVGKLMASERIQSFMQEVMKSFRKISHPQAHGFLFNSVNYKRISKITVQAPTAIGPGRAGQDRGAGAGCAWPPPKFVDWLCGKQCPVLDCGGSKTLPPEALDFIEQGRPCIFRNLSVFPAAFERWSFRYLSENLTDTPFSVFSSEDGDYSYWYGKPNSAGFAFSNPTRRQAMPFPEFLKQQEALARGCVYLQDPLYYDKADCHGLRREVMSAELLRDWESGLSWEALDQVRRAGGLGALSTSSLFCSGRGAYSRPHYDQSSNLYLQIRGAKRWLLFAPEDGPKLYPYPKGHPLDRKSRLDFGAPQVEAFPAASELRGRGIEAVIQPGEVLWLPSHWWHSVHSLEAETLALNFWWPPSDDPREMPWEHAAVEIARDIESVMQSAVGPQAVERFLQTWQRGGLAGAAEERRLRCMLLMHLIRLREAGVLQTPSDIPQTLSFLDPRRYAGLAFSGGSGLEGQAPSVALDGQSAKTRVGRPQELQRAPAPKAPKATAAVRCGRASCLASSYPRDWRAREGCRRASVRGAARRGAGAAAAATAARPT